MTPVILLSALVLVPIAVLVVLRINATLVFLSLCLGNVLVQFVAPDAQDFLNLFTAKTSQSVSANDGTVRLVLLLLPVVLTAFFMIRTVKGRFKLLLNLLPAAGVGLLGALLVVPLLPAGTGHDILASKEWVQIARAQNIIVGASALVCLLVLWMQRPKTGGGSDEKHGKKKKD